MLLMLYEATCLLKTVTGQVKPSMPRPSDISDLSEERSVKTVPDILFNFVAALCGAVPETECDLLGDKLHASSPRLHRRVLAICQDIIFTASAGRVWSPESIAASKEDSEDEARRDCCNDDDDINTEIQELY